MAEKKLVLKEKLEQSGIFDFSGVYEYAHSWLKGNFYGVNEDKYAEKVSGNSRDIDIEWKAGKKVSDYFKIELSIKFEIKGMSEVEVEMDGKKKKMNKGKLSIEMKGTLVSDYNSKWEETPTNKFFRGIYDKFIIPSKTNEVEDQVEDDLRALKEDLKAYLDLVGKR